MDNTDVKTVGDVKKKFVEYLKILSNTVDINEYELNDSGDIEGLENVPYFSSKFKAILGGAPHIDWDYVAVQCIHDVQVDKSEFSACISLGVEEGDLMMLVEENCVWQRLQMIFFLGCLFI